MNQKLSRRDMKSQGPLISQLTPPPVPLFQARVKDQAKFSRQGKPVLRIHSDLETVDLRNRGLPLTGRRVLRDVI